GRGQAAAYECFVGLVKPGWRLDGGGTDTGATGALDRRIRTLKRDTLAGSQRVTGDDTPIREALGDVRRSVNPRKLKIKLAACQFDKLLILPSCFMRRPVKRKAGT